VQLHFRNSSSSVTMSSATVMMIFLFLFLVIIYELIRIVYEFIRKGDKCPAGGEAAARLDKIDKMDKGDEIDILSCAAHLSFLSREAHSPCRAAAFNS
jgi:hypothetical protein